ncbi:MAG: DNA polymerase IV, partial [Bacteroidota bacterium]
SYEARRFGIHAAMPSRMAKQLCPDAIFLRGDMEEYAHYSRLVTEIIDTESPLFEKASIDEFYVDLSGMDQYFGCFAWAKLLRQKIIAESGLPISFGLSANKLVSKVGTGEAKPNGIHCVERGQEKVFLSPLSIRKLPSVGRVTYKKLSFMGVRTIRTLSQIPVRLLQREFGKNGIGLWKKANGIDRSPVVPYQDQKSMSSERTFAIDSIDIVKIKSILTQLTSQLVFELRQSTKLTSCVTVKIRYTDFNTYTRQKRIAYTANEKTLLEQVLDLFDRLYERRQLIRLVGLRFSGLVNGHHQLNLLDDQIEDIHLQQAMDRIRRRFGKKAVGWASALQGLETSKSGS